MKEVDLFVGLDMIYLFVYCQCLLLTMTIFIIRWYHGYVPKQQHIFDLIVEIHSSCLSNFEIKAIKEIKVGQRL